MIFIAITFVDCARDINKIIDVLTRLGNTVNTVTFKVTPVRLLIILDIPLILVVTCMISSYSSLNCRCKVESRYINGVLQFDNIGKISVL